MSTPWTTRGLGTVIEDNVISQPLYNIAYYLETNLQTQANDPSYAARTSKQKRMVFLSYPSVNPLRPYIVIERVAFDGGPIGKDHVNSHQDFQIKVIASSTEVVDTLAQKIFVALKNARETLHDYNMHYDPVAFLASFLPTQPDPEMGKTFFTAQIYRFFHIIN